MAYHIWLEYDWGEHERAPHRRLCCGICQYIYIYIVHRAVGHFQLLFCEFLHHSLIQNFSPTTQPEGNSKDGDHLWTTYSITRAIGMAKRFHLSMPLFVSRPTSPMATSMSISVRGQPQCICSAQSRHLCNLEIVLHILRITKLRADLKIAWHQFAISRSHGTGVQSRDSAAPVRTGVSR